MFLSKLKFQFLKKLLKAFGYFLSCHKKILPPLNQTNVYLGIITLVEGKKNAEENLVFFRLQNN
jgi:hypothetical protein